MVTQEDLRSLAGKWKRLRREQRQLEYLSEKSTALASTATDAVKVQTSVTNRSMMYADSVIDQEAIVAQAIEDLQPELTKVKEFTQALPMWSTERRVMELRYCKGYEWEDVADIMSYSDSQIFRAHRRVLKLLKKMTVDDS